MTEQRGVAQTERDGAGEGSVEGVIKFGADHVTRALTEREDETARGLLGWRALLWRAGVIGQDPRRYGGAGFGNISARTTHGGDRRARAFVVTGTQTQARERIDTRDCAVVTAWDERKNRVTSHGPALPSSESLTHGALYDASSDVRAVFHVHCPDVFAAVRARTAAWATRIPTTPPDVDYGTTAMARSVAELWRSSALPHARVLVMLGHEDGVVTFGKAPDEAGDAMMRTIALALSR